MAIRWIDWAFRVKCPSSSAKFVLVKLADNANDEGSCWPSLDYIAAHTQLTRPTIIKAIKALEDAGLLSVERQRVGGVNLPNQYQLCETGGVVKPLYQGSKATLPGGSKATLPEPSLSEPSLNRQLESVSPETPPDPKKASNGQGSRLPETWSVDPDLWKWAETEYPGIDVGEQEERFIDYWNAQPGARGRKVDWNATFRNWIRKAADFERNSAYRRN